MASKIIHWLTWIFCLTYATPLSGQSAAVPRNEFPPDATQAPVVVPQDSSNSPVYDAGQVQLPPQGQVEDLPEGQVETIQPTLVPSSEADFQTVPRPIFR